MDTAGGRHTWGDPGVLEVMLARRGAGAAGAAAVFRRGVRVLVRGGERGGVPDRVRGGGGGVFPRGSASRRFIDPRRLLLGRPVVSLDYFLDDVLAVRKPLRWDLLGAGAARMRIVATDAADLRAHELTPRSPAQWQAAVRASARIPLLAGAPVRVAGRRWIDGSVSEPLAAVRAAQGGATHVLFLLCRGAGELDPRPVGPLPWWNRALDRAVPGLGTLLQGTRRYTAELAAIDATSRTEHTGHAQVLAVGPSRSVGVTSLCIEPERVARAVEVGAHTMADVVARA